LHPDRQTMFFALKRTTVIYTICVVFAIACLSTAGVRSNGYICTAAAFDPPVTDEWDEVFDTARAVLAKLPDSTRIESTIKDSALRDAVLKTYQSVKACAKVHREQARATKQGVLAEFERAFKSVQTEASRGEYQACAAKCASEDAKCQKDCEAAKKKMCSCRLKEFGAFLTQCVFG
jgi:hypothetical protein